MPETSSLVGRYIVIWGVTGSGKTTLAKALAEALGLPVVHLDAIRHRNGWDSTDWPEFRSEVGQTLDLHADGWVLEGGYSPIMDLYLSRVDTMVWLRLPWRVCFWRLLQRTVARAWDQKPLYHPDGPRESWRLAFFSRQSILWWSISQHRRARRNQRERIASLPKHVRVHELCSLREVHAFREMVAQARRVTAS